MSDGGIPLESFDAVEEFVDSLQADALEDDDRTVHGSHLLSILIESVLESLSTAQLSRPIAGLDSDSICKARRKLERRNEREELQRLLYSSEKLAELIQEAGYGEADSEDNSHFFEDLFPDWLERLFCWAEAEGHDELVARVDAALGAYMEIVDDIVL